MKSFDKFREECDCKDKERKTKSKKKSQVEVMPRIPDAQKGMTTNVNNESRNYEGPLYAPWSKVVDGRGFDPITERAKSKSQQRFFGMVRAAQKGEMEKTSPEVSKAAASMSKSDVKDFAKTKHKGLPEKKVKKESFESGVMKARRHHRVGKLMSFKDFMKIMGEILGEWEK
jgi:hypothetical protein